MVIPKSDIGQTYQKQQWKRSTRKSFASPSKNTDQKQKKMKKQKDNCKGFCVTSKCKKWEQKTFLGLLVGIT